MNKIVLCFFCVVGLFASCKAEEVIYRPMFDCSKSLIEPYGIVAHISRTGPSFEYDTREKGLDIIKSASISNVRVDFDWTSFRRGYVRDSVSFEVFDKMMKSVCERHLNMLGVISNTDTEHFPLWCYQTEMLVKRYKESVNYWEIVNEADLIFKKNPNYTPKEYVSILKAGYNIIKRNKNKSKVLYTGLDANAERSFFEETLKMGAASYFDIMNVHFYTVHRGPEVLIDYYGVLKKKLSKYNIRKPVWMTECGYPTKGELSETEEEQAIRLPRAYLVSFACGVDKVFWYNLKASELTENDRECHFGILHKDYTTKPAYLAYKTLIKMCPNKSTRPVLSQMDGLYLAKWKRTDGIKVVALWSSKGEIPIKINSKSRYKCYNVFGKEIAFSQDNTIVSQSILYLEGNKEINIVID